MPYPIEDKLVVAIASSAILTLDGARDAFREGGVEAYRAFQREHQDEPLAKGPAFAFIKRLLSFNRRFPDVAPVEVVLISHNDPDTGLRVFNTLEHYGLDVTRSAFITGAAPHLYMDAFNASLFLSKNVRDVEAAIAAGYPAGTVLPSVLNDDEDDPTLRIAFDFDGVLADSSSEAVYREKGLAAFQEYEREHASVPCLPGPLADLFRKLGRLRALEAARAAAEPGYKPMLETSIVTARGVPAHVRVVNTLRNWDITVDRAFFLGGVDKGRILSVLRPHIFFDDQEHPHLDVARDFSPSVHIPITAGRC